MYPQKYCLEGRQAWGDLSSSAPKARVSAPSTRSWPWWSCFSSRTTFLVVTSGALCSQLHMWLEEWELWCVVRVVSLLLGLTNWVMILHFWRQSASLTSTLPCHHAYISRILQPMVYYFKRLWDTSFYVWLHFGELSRVSCVTCHDDRKVIPALVPCHHMSQNSMKLHIHRHRTLLLYLIDNNTPNNMWDYRFFWLVEWIQVIASIGAKNENFTYIDTAKEEHINPSMVNIIAFPNHL